jgi:hypothetical protein
MSKHRVEPRAVSPSEKINFFGQTGFQGFNRTLKPSAKYTARPASSFRGINRRSDSNELAKTTNIVGIEKIIDSRRMMQYGSNSTNKLATVLGFPQQTRVKSAHMRQNTEVGKDVFSQTCLGGEKP